MKPLCQLALQPPDNGLDSVFLPERMETSVPATPPEVIFDNRMKGPFQRTISSPAVFAVNGETCGLLLGRKLPGGKHTILVEGYHSVPADASQGGAPHLTTVHERLLEATIAMYVNQPSLKVLGMYRTCRSGDFTLTPADMDLFTRYFHDPGSMYLLLRPVSMDTSVGALFWPGRGGGETTPVDMILGQETSHVPLTYRPGSGTPAGWLRRASYALVVIPILLIGVGWQAWNTSVGAREQEVAAEQEKMSRVQLEIVRGGNDLLISWKRPAPGAPALVTGRLVVNDSALRKEFVLDSQQLASGRLIYQPVTSDVNVTFQATTLDGRTVTDSLRAFYPAAGQTPPAPLTEFLRPGAEQQEMTRESVFEVRTHVPDGEKASVAARRKFTPAQRKASAPEPSVPDAPDVAQLAASVQNPIPQVPVSREPIPGWQQREERAPAAPLVVTNSTMTPATAITTVQPAVSPAVRKAIQRAVMIPVQVSISAEGRVTGTSVESRSTAWEVPLAAAAEQAAMKWRFTPANVDGHPVPAQVTINFRFVP
jgi:protein TonB